MLTKLKWIFGLLLFVTVFVVLHYNLPQRDIVRITGTEVLRKSLSGAQINYQAATTLNSGP